MKKNIYKKIIFSAVLCMSLLPLAACGQQSPSNSEGNNKNTSPAAISNQEGPQGGPDNKKERDHADLMGRVTKIVGNEVTIELAEMPKRQESQNNTSSTNEEKAVMPAATSSGQSSSNGDGPGGGGMPPSGGQGNRKGMELTFTGETKTFTIPVGIPITSRSPEGEKTLEIADIYAGVTIQVWLNKNDQSKASSISIMQQSSGSSNNG